VEGPIHAAARAHHRVKGLRHVEEGPLHGVTWAPHVEKRVLHLAGWPVQAQESSLRDEIDRPPPHVSASWIDSVSREPRRPREEIVIRPAFSLSGNRPIVDPGE
jgi:hypothetical protein